LRSSWHSSDRGRTFERAIGGFTMADTLGFVAATWGVLMALSPLLQIRRMLERRSSADVSMAYLAVLQIGFVLWVGYGISLGNLALIVPNSVALAIGLVTMAIAWTFRHGRPAPATAAK
jgi:uncharacterized protein with PQ loop repeat